VQTPGTQQGPWSAILAQLMSAIQQLLSLLGGSGGNQSPCQGQSYFSSANGASVGDPHMRFDGRTANGQWDQNVFKSQSDHPDLLDSDSFAGGYQLSTAVTQPNPNGSTYNRCATVSTDGGATQVSLDNDGEAMILQNGQKTSLQDGQTIKLSNGETVMRSTDGSVKIVDQNTQGGKITTTLSNTTEGVSVGVQAANVDLGGDLVNEPAAQPFNAPFAQPFNDPFGNSFENDPFAYQFQNQRIY